jgi:glycosidase
LGEDHLYPHPERLVPFFGNHDTRRFLSEPGASPARLRLAFALLATLRGMPEIYSGDEIAMEGGEDPDNRRDFPGGFHGASHDAFTSSGRTADEQAMFSWTANLLHLRSSHPAITAGEQQDLFADSTAIAFLRGTDLAEGCQRVGGSDRILVLVSKATESRKVDLNEANTGLAGCGAIAPIFPASAPAIMLNDGKLSVGLGPDGVAIYSVH